MFNAAGLWIWVVKDSDQIFCNVLECLIPVPLPGSANRATLSNVSLEMESVNINQRAAFTTRQKFQV